MSAAGCHVAASPVGPPQGAIYLRTDVARDAIDSRLLPVLRALSVFHIFPGFNGPACYREGVAGICWCTASQWLHGTSGTSSACSR